MDSDELSVRNRRAGRRVLVAGAGRRPRPRVPRGLAPGPPRPSRAASCSGWRSPSRWASSSASFDEVEAGANRRAHRRVHPRAPREGDRAEPRGAGPTRRPRRLLAARLCARAQRALDPREERLRLRELLDFPRRAAPTPSPARGRARPVRDLPAAASRGGRPAGRGPSRRRRRGARAGDAQPRAELAAGSRAPGRGVAAGYLTDYLPRADARGPGRGATARASTRTGGRIAPRARADRGRWTAAGMPLRARAPAPARRGDARAWSPRSSSRRRRFRALDAIRPTAVVITSNRRLGRARARPRRGAPAASRGCSSPAR